MTIETRNRIITLNSYQACAMRTAGAEGNAALAGFALGVAGEAGEVADYIKKVLFHGHDLDRMKVCKELGDVLWYVAALGHTCGLTLTDIANVNLDKLQTRYPDKFSSEHSKTRRDEVDNETSQEAKSHEDKQWSNH